MMRPGVKKCKKVKISRVKLQKQVAAAEGKARVLRKYYEEKVALEEQKHKNLMELQQDEHQEQSVKLAQRILDLRDEKSSMNKIIADQQERNSRLENENQLLYKMMEKKPNLLDKIKQKLSK